MGILMADRMPGVTEDIYFAYKSAAANYIVYPKEEHV